VARDAQGNDLSCWTNAPSQVAAIQALNGDSYLLFYAGASTGQCTYLQTINGSPLSPKEP
jgi:hypothetical protein